MIDFQYIENNKLNNTDDLSLWINSVIIEEKMMIGELVYVLCNDEYLLKKNIQFLNHNTLTDVITFDYSENKIISGDILISTERVSENAKIFNVNYLTELRIENACKILKSNKDMAIVDVAFKAGFYNISNFNRRFKELKKMTPLTFRNL